MANTASKFKSRRVVANCDVEIWDFDQKEILDTVAKGTFGTIVGHFFNDDKKVNVKWDDGKIHFVLIRELDSFDPPKDPTPERAKAVMATLSFQKKSADLMAALDWFATTDIQLFIKPATKGWEIKMVFLPSDKKI